MIKSVVEILYNINKTKQNKQNKHKIKTLYMCVCVCVSMQTCDFNAYLNNISSK